MAGIKINASFELGAGLPIDTRLLLSKAEMLTINDNVWPSNYLTLCKDDGKVYVYTKSNDMDPETGKFRELSSGGAEFLNLTANSTTTDLELEPFFGADLANLRITDFNPNADWSDKLNPAHVTLGHYIDADDVIDVMKVGNKLFFTYHSIASITTYNTNNIFYLYEADYTYGNLSNAIKLYPSESITVDSLPHIDNEFIEQHYADKYILKEDDSDGHKAGHIYKVGEITRLGYNIEIENFDGSAYIFDDYNLYDGAEGLYVTYDTPEGIYHYSTIKYDSENDNYYFDGLEEYHFTQSNVSDEVSPLNHIRGWEDSYKTIEIVDELPEASSLYENKIVLKIEKSSYGDEIVGATQYICVGVKVWNPEHGYEYHWKDISGKVEYETLPLAGLASVPVVLAGENSAYEKFKKGHLYGYVIYDGGHGYPRTFYKFVDSYDPSDFVYVVGDGISEPEDLLKTPSVYNEEGREYTNKYISYAGEESGEWYIQVEHGAGSKRYVRDINGDTEFNDYTYYDITEQQLSKSVSVDKASSSIYNSTPITIMSQSSDGKEKGHIYGYDEYNDTWNEIQFDRMFQVNRDNATSARTWIEKYYNESFLYENTILPAIMYVGGKGSSPVSKQLKNGHIYRARQGTNNTYYILSNYDYTFYSKNDNPQIGDKVYTIQIYSDNDTPDIHEYTITNINNDIYTVGLETGTADVTFSGEQFSYYDTWWEDLTGDRLETTTSMPMIPYEDLSNGKLIEYSGETSSEYIKGHIYKPSIIESKSGVFYVWPCTKWEPSSPNIIVSTTPTFTEGQTVYYTKNINGQLVYVAGTITDYFGWYIKEEEDRTNYTAADNYTEQVNQINNVLGWSDVYSSTSNYDDLENKPLSLNRGVELFNEEVTGYNDEHDVYNETLSEVIELEIGSKYIININGVNYNCVGEDASDLGTNYVKVVAIDDNENTLATFIYNGEDATTMVLPIIAEWLTTKPTISLSTDNTVIVNPDYQEFFNSIGGDSKLTEDVTANIAVGGIEIGQTLSMNTTFTDVIKSILIKYYAPTISMSFSGAVLNKKGTTITSGKTITATSVKKSENIVYTQILDSSDNVLATGTNPSGEALTYTTESDITEDTTFKSKVTDGKSTINATLNIEFIDPYYVGVSNTNVLDQTSIENMTEVLEKKGNKTKAYTGSNQYFVFAYPTSYNDLSEIIDQNNFDNTGAWSKQVIIFNEGEPNEVSYNVYVSNDPITNTNFKYTFKY